MSTLEVGGSSALTVIAEVGGEAAFVRDLNRGGAISGTFEPRLGAATS